MDKIFTTFSLAALTLMMPIYSEANDHPPRIEVSAERALLDQDIQIALENLYPNEEIEIHAKVTDDNQVEWASWARFKVNKQGRLNLHEQEPLEGSYRAADAMGLFWSMQPSNMPSAAFKIRNDEFPVELKVLRDGQEIAQATVIRLRKDPDVKKIPVQEKGLRGTLFLPPSSEPLPVIVTLSGSNGGLGENRAQLLASNGFAAFALGYFGVEGLPSNLQDIPMEYFETAFSWLKSHPLVDGSSIGIFGVSRGAELALILSSLFPDDIQAVVATVPSSVVYGGLSETPVNAWLYQGKPLAPFAPVPPIDFSGDLGMLPTQPANILESFRMGMNDREAFEAAAIPVEKIKAPLLLISGGDDQMWPSAFYASQIQERLRAKGSTIPCQHLHYPKAGHGIGIPNIPQSGPVYYHPVGKRWFSVGGSIEEDQRASKESWKEIIDFYHEVFQINRS